MSRPVSIHTESILKAAQKIFLKRGYKASTKMIASEAGISEGSLFKHFKTKQDLFVAAMEADVGGVAWADELMKSAGSGDMRAALEKAGMQMLQRLEIVLPRMIMVRSSGIVLARPSTCGGHDLPGPIRKLHTLANYFRAEAKTGRLAMRNPELYAQIFMGTLTHYVIQKMIFKFRAVSPKVYVNTVVDMILRAVTPSGKGGKGCLA